MHEAVDRPDLLCDPDNTPPLCSACHAAVSTMERNGQAAQARALFIGWRARWDAILGRTADTLENPD